MNDQTAIRAKIAKLEKSLAKQKNFAMRAIDAAIIARLKSELN